MVQLQVAAVISALGLALVACGSDRPAKDASSANGSQSTESNTGDTPSGNSTPTDSTIGTGMAPDSGNGSPGASAGNGSDASGTGSRGSGSSGQ